MIPLAVPNLSGNEGKYLQECVTSTFVSSVGPFVSRFEQMVAVAAGWTHGVATSAGTTGLHAALTAVGVKRDDLVVVPAFTFIASANAIAHCGAVPWLLDVDVGSWTLDPQQLEDCFARDAVASSGALIHRSSGKRVAAIMPVFTLGTPADMAAIGTIAGRYSVPIVVDAAAALGATYRGSLPASTGAALTVFSFNGNKTVTAGGGGAVVGNDQALCDLVRHLTTTARRGSDYDHDMVGFNYRMTNLQAAVGCAQLEQLDAFVRAKRAIGARYDAELGSLPGAGRFPQPNWAESARWFSGITLDAELVQRMIPDLRKDGVDARPFWKPIHLQAPYHASPRASLDRTEAVWRTVLTLPCSTNLTSDDQSTVILTVKNWLARH